MAVETLEGYSILQIADGWWAYAGLQTGWNAGTGPDRMEECCWWERLPDGPGAAPARDGHRGKPPQPGRHGYHSPSIEAPKAPESTNLENPGAAGQIQRYYPDLYGCQFPGIDVLDQHRLGARISTAKLLQQMDIVPAEETCGTANDGITNWTDLGYTHPNTGSTFDNCQSGHRLECRSSANNGCIDFARFDTNGNGYIETSELAIVVVVAGYEHAYNATTPMQSGRTSGS